MVYVHDETAYPVDLGAPELRKLCGGALWDEARVVDEQWEHHVKHLQKIKVPQSTVGICWYGISDRIYIKIPLLVQKTEDCSTNHW